MQTDQLLYDIQSIFWSNSDAIYLREQFRRKKIKGSNF